MSEMATWQSDVEKSYYFILGVSFGGKYWNTQKALAVAKKMHEGQYRRGGAEYIVHPLRVCSLLISLGFEDDILFSAALLHDVVEDVEYIKNNPDRLVKEFGISEDVLKVVMLLSKNETISKEEYFRHIKEDWRALIIKLSDRCNNVSTLQCFTREKMQKYIDETKEYILPLCKYGKTTYPQYSGLITAMKYHITSNCETAQAFLDFENLSK